MGNDQSNSPPPRPQRSSMVLPYEWRDVPWKNKAEELQHVKEYQPFNEDVQLRFMLCGSVGAGKSSFINSVESVLRGRITGRAATDAMARESFTTSYKAYRFQKGGSGTHYPFVFNDIMGLEKDAGRGVCVEDVKLAMKGHVKDGYNFNPHSTLSENNQDYNRDPSLSDRVHVLVCVIPGSTSGMQDDSVKKLREVRLAARDMGIPEIAILTKIDEACPEVGKDIRNVYKSKYLKKKIEEVSGELGFPQSCIFPVKNYNSEIDTKDDTDTLILSALRRMIESGEDFVNNKDNTMGNNNPPPSPPLPPPCLPTPPPPSPKVLPHEWTNVHWKNKVEELQHVKDYQPFKEDVQLRFMLCGSVGAGKSSFINSVESVLQGKICNLAGVDALSDGSFTTSYKAYRFQKGGPGTHYPFVFNDIMGLEKDAGRGVCVEDVKLAMKGHVKDGYNFIPHSTFSENNQAYNRDPSLNDRVHVLVCVIPGNIAGLQDDDSGKKLSEVRLAARDMGIPEIAILTKIDEACPEVGKDIKNVYKSKHLKKKIEEVSGELGFPPSCIFPVKNYHSEIDTKDDTDTLILSALRRMIESGEDFVNEEDNIEAMGNYNPHPSPPSPKVLPQEWRNVPWGNKVRDVQIVKEYQPFKDKAQLRFMLYGPAGAGKSSFINSVESVLRGKIANRAGKSFTTSYKAYKIEKGGPGTHYPFVFNDVMSLEKDEGVCVEDIKLAMKGHVKDGYNFNPICTLSEDNQHYNRDPSLNDRVHVLVCIIPGSIAGLQDDSVKKLREVRLAARDMGIPEIAILTKIDETSPEVGKDIQNVYKSKHLKNKIEEVSGELGFPPSCIFPVKNYHSGLETSDDTDTLILSALRRMIECGEDFVNDL